MPDFISLTCPTCGGKLQITPDIERFACAHCGNEHLVRRATGVVTLAPVVESMDGLRRATDRTATELAIRRMRDEIAELESAKTQVESRLTPLNAKIAEHDKWRRNVRSMPLVLAFALLCGVGFFLVDGDALSRPYFSSDSAQTLAIALFIMGAVMLLLWAVTLLLLYTVYAIHPPRRQVEAGIQALQAEIQNIDNARLAKQAELQEHLKLVRSQS